VRITAAGEITQQLEALRRGEREAEAHLAECVDCQRRYRFEESLRIYVRKAVTEEMSPELRQKLAALRIPLE